MYEQRILPFIINNQEITTKEAIEPDYEQELFTFSKPAVSETVPPNKPEQSLPFIPNVSSKTGHSADGSAKSKPAGAGVPTALPSGTASSKTPPQDNKLRYTDNRILYHIQVKDYMTKATPPGGKFDFMLKWNDNNPMPCTLMSGFKLKETNGMVYMKLHGTYPPFLAWTGWIIKSAILSEKPVSIFEAKQFMARVTQKEIFRVTLYIDKSDKKNKFSIRVVLSEQNPTVTAILKDSFYAKQEADLTYRIAIRYFEDLQDALARYPVTIENPHGYDSSFEFRYEEHDLITDYPMIEFKTKPLPHQLEAYHWGMQRMHMLIADDQGLGKSFESINIALGKREQFGYKRCLIICGVNSLKWNWMKEIETHSNEKGHILGARKTRDGKIRVKGSKEKLDDLKNLQDIDAFFLITNAETIRNKEICKELQRLYEEKELSMIIIDEFHKVKNIKCKQGSNMIHLQADCKLALTGTPMLNSPLDIFGAARWLGHEKHSLSEFTCFYRKKINETATYRHMDILKDNLSLFMLRRRKEDVVDLPEKIYMDEYVEMGNKQQKLYDEVRDELIKDIDEIEKSPNPLANMLRLRQVTGHPGILSELEESAKFERMKELVEDYIEEGRKVVLFSNWTEVTDRAYEALKAYKPLMITGDINDSERMSIMEEFQHSPERQIIIGSIGAMGTGFTLTAAEAVIFLDEPWADGMKEQAVDRAHRIGTKKTVYVHTLICKDSVDERVNMIVNMKKDMSAIMVDGKNVKDNMARFLLGLEE